MNASVKLILREDYVRNDGTNPVNLRLTINRKSKYYSLGIFILKEDLKKNKFEIKDSIKGSKITNIQLVDSITKAEQILLDFRKFSNPPTFIEFEKRFKGNFSKKHFKAFAEKWIENNAELSKETKRTYSSQITKLGNFITSIDTLTFQEVNNHDFINSYRNYMINILGNKTNTIYKSLAFIRTIINVAISHSILAKNVFDDIKLRKVPGYREFLSYSEINKLEKLFHSSKLNQKQKNVLQYFLFSCYTGLRYTDIKCLRYRDIFSHNALNPIKNQKKTWKLILIEMHKTKLDVEIPLLDKALQLINNDDDEPNQKVFRVISNQKTNKYLKEIMKVAKIDRWNNISYHCSRHSFAINLIQQGVSYHYVSKLLGHTNTETTEIYTKPNRDYLIDAMSKLNN